MDAESNDTYLLLRDTNSSLTNSTEPHYNPYLPAYIIFPHILAIGLLSMSILLLSTCGIFLFRVCMWSEERRRERHLVAEQELQTATALSMIDALESGSYEEVVLKSPTLKKSLDKNGSERTRLEGAAGEASSTNATEATDSEKESSSIAIGSLSDESGGQQQPQQQQEKEEEEEETCCVCLCEFSREEIVRRLPCEHYFHAECVDHWLKRSMTCPSCRWSLLTDDGSDPEQGNAPNSTAASEASTPSLIRVPEGRVMFGLADLITGGVVVTRSRIL